MSDRRLYLEEIFRPLIRTDNVYIHRTINSTTAQQGEERTVKGAYMTKMITTPTYLETTQ
jgi:hypothetical protein